MTEATVKLTDKEKRELAHRIRVRDRTTRNADNSLRDYMDELAEAHDVPFPLWDLDPVKGEFRERAATPARPLPVAPPPAAAPAKPSRSDRKPR